MQTDNIRHLLTEEGEKLSGTPWQAYPRPQMVRDSYLCLNGNWDFAAVETEPEEYTESILVPFPPQSLLSGVNRTFNKSETLFYRRGFTLPDGFKKDRVLLHIGACDQVTEVFINGHYAGCHVGGYNAFCFDITEHLVTGENEIKIRVTDDPDSTLLPYGKQKKNRGGMWYTPVAGIWQTVWLESVCEGYIENIQIQTGADFAEIYINGPQTGTVRVTTPAGEQEVKIEEGRARLKFNDPVMWSPENPYLYRFTVTSGQDTVSSYFALRTLSIREIDGIPRLCLNGKPYFFHGLLDQGYFSDGIYTPASPKCFENDIMAMKAMGFNMLRKHIKVEPEQFYYDCDRLGMVVFQDMVNNGKYSFFRDTALPTIGLKRLSDKCMHRNNATREQFVKCMETTVAQLRNHPSICYWTVFNEGWGQFCSSEMYHRLKAIDSTRFIDSASGWFTGGDSDVISPHIYFKRIKIKPSEKPVVLSEFGGYSYKPEGHVFNTADTYGYRFFTDINEFGNALENLYLKEIIPTVKNGLCGAVYTQVSDVEDETNGLLSYDRKVQKIDTQRMKDISVKLLNEFENLVK